MADGEVELPEEILHRIQSMMEERDGARTSVLSKSWNHAWLTRPNICFDQGVFQSHFRRRFKRPWHPTTDGFPEFTRKTLKRYEDSKLSIEVFHLIMYLNGLNLLSKIGVDEELATKGLAEELIVRAMRLGPRIIKIYLNDPSFFIPGEVFESKTLTKLTLDRCAVNLVNLVNLMELSRVEYLNFYNVVVKGVEGEDEGAFCFDSSSKLPTCGNLLKYLRRSNYSLPIVLRCRLQCGLETLELHLAHSIRLPKFTSGLLYCCRPNFIIKPVFLFREQYDSWKKENWAIRYLSETLCWTPEGEGTMVGRCPSYPLYDLEEVKVYEARGHDRLWQHRWHYVSWQKWRTWCTLFKNKSWFRLIRFELKWRRKPSAICSEIIYGVF